MAVTIGTYSLISEEYAKAYLGISVTTHDTLLGYLIDAASARIETHCDRHFVAREFTEYYDGSEYFSLRNYPVIQIRRVSNQTKPGIHIQNTDTTKGYATVSKTGTDFWTDDGTSTSYDLEDTDYDTLTELTAALTAVSGWTATLKHSNGAQPSTNLIDVFGADCHTPGSFTLDVAHGALTFQCNKSNGQLYLVSGFGGGEQGIRVVYTAGYSLTPASLSAGESPVPPDVQLACVELLKLFYDEHKKDWAVMSENVGNYSYSSAISSALNTLPFTHRMIDRLSPHTRYYIG